MQYTDIQPGKSDNKSWIDRVRMLSKSYLFARDIAKNVAVEGHLHSYLAMGGPAYRFHAEATVSF